MVIIVKRCDKNLCSKNLYIEKYGHHFNDKLSQYAVSLMNHSNKATLSFNQVLDMLEKYGIEPTSLYDAFYVANMGYHDFYKSSIKDEEHLAQFVKDYLEDEDGYEGIAFCRWLTDMCNKSKEIDWDNMI